MSGVLVLVIAAVTYGSVALDTLLPPDAERELAAFTPSAERPDPATAISGVRVQEFRGGEHDTADDPGYETRPPVGGPHGTRWAACSGAAYLDPVSDAEAVHSLEHGAVWITDDPARTPAVVLRAPTARVTGDPYLLLSPYPGLDAPLSLQAWGHRLTLDTPEDPRFEQFVQALRNNPYTPPEPGGECGRAPGR
ncbi:DUF3105 domain-containing protein [Pseudonocardia kunmingensis]|uniref:Uncharacterized protein DUF3105 n=1 Tax=Pseudonocardia kunmingensis TaxID=630975 RepID=A0A543DKV1_9PSEU|nr:DUF3105 domain-containing protein [Pseudonocardia kunmingensis]TQM09885.1 uncharacterized protein DUF3105 [Pseudonocardia kunmingensis]